MNDPLHSPIADRSSMRPHRALVMTSLILAGECVYTLPYYLRRDFGPVMVEVFGLSQLELGWLSSMFGIFALLCYWPGGWVADRRAPRRLLAFSLLTTGLGGMLLLLTPSFEQLVWLYAAWGISTILTFWGALIRSTRAWGGPNEQGRAFGILDAGRGLTGAAVAAGAVALFSWAPNPTRGLHHVVTYYSVLAILVSLLVWFALQQGESEALVVTEHHHNRGFFDVIARPTVRTTGLIIAMAYTTYWATFDLSQFAVSGYGMSELEGASLSASAVWLRVPSALAAGWFADRIGTRRTLTWVFTGLLIAFLSAASLRPGPNTLFAFYLQAAGVAMGAYALRGIYYALLEEAELPNALTGVAVGLVSTIGYVPDVIIPPLSGWLFDRFPGAAGHRLYFLVQAGVCVVGILATLRFQSLLKPRHSST